MAITPADIESMTFSAAKKNGYNTEEVDAFLDQLSGEVDAMLHKLRDLCLRGRQLLLGAKRRRWGVRVPSHSDSG